MNSIVMVDDVKNLFDDVKRRGRGSPEDFNPDDFRRNRDSTDKLLPATPKELNPL
jgi:hypothetical protein